MNPNVFASYALFSRLASFGVTHAVISPGSRSTPVAYVAHELFDTTVVIDERDAGFVALGIAESTGCIPVVITTSGSAPTHLYPSIAEAFHSNVGMIVITADRPHEVRGRGAPQTIDQINMFSMSVRFFHDTLCPHDEDSDIYWHERADELFSHASGVGSVAGPVHLNMGIREPLVPDGDEKQKYESQSVIHASGSPQPDVRHGVFGFSSSATSERIFLSAIRDLIAGAQKGIVTIGRNSGLSPADMATLNEVVSWPVLADITSNVRCCENTISAYDTVVRRGDAKQFLPDVVLQFGDPLTSKLFNEFLSPATVVSLRSYDDHRNAYGNASHFITLSEPSMCFDELRTINYQQTPQFTDEWREAHRQSIDVIAQTAVSASDSEPAFFLKLGKIFTECKDEISVLVASSMPIRYAEWLWVRPAESVRVYSHRGANGIDGMISSTYGIAHGSQVPTLCVVGDVAFAHDIGFLSHCAQLTKEKNACVVFFVIDNGGGAIFRHLPQAGNATMADSYEEIMQTPPGIDIEALSRACGA
ncbi:MAG TPA: 2-succinyl-5-enolpyruvyl-6-hydroxy-3-cyclohexene-1-carboxylic-acid synthase, partial [Acidimicrobiia bacterium]|nr:2-succinyl-5-enolpyruvyl-6-hydroxy-3-cyclohexene-1-carboxylic-acid synthase [Acidimicrobiia bacterium]